MPYLPCPLAPPLPPQSDRTALHLLLDRPGELSAEQLLFAEMVVSRGFDIDLVDSEGATALHVAARQGHLRGVVLLLTLGAKTLLKNTAREGLRHHSHLGKHAVSSARQSNASGLSTVYLKQVQLASSLSPPPQAKKYASDVVPEGAFAVRAAILQEMVKEWQRVIAALVDLQVVRERQPQPPRCAQRASSLRIRCSAGRGGCCCCARHRPG